jgi:DNA-binding transcriptional LysR family regulator
MSRKDLPDLSAFAAVASAGSFTKAAAQLGISQSSLSHAIRGLEERLGVRLLSRTTRSVATTDAGDQLLRTLRPALDGIDAGLAMLTANRGKPAGQLRLTMVKHAAMSLMRPALPAFLATYPDIKVEIAIDDGLTDIVAARFDAGIRFGKQVQKDMISVRIGKEARAAVVASPSYLSTRSAPRKPQDLALHRCINYRLATAGGLYAWEFKKGGRRFDVRVDGWLVLNDGDLIEATVLDGLGIGYLFEDQVAPHLASGRLVRLLESWCPPFDGYYLYYTSRRQMPPALGALISFLRFRVQS